MMFADFANRVAAVEAAEDTEADRLALRLWQYWDSVRGGRRFPPSPSTRFADVGEHGFTLDLSDAGGEPVFGFIGQAIAAQCGHDLTGRPVSEAPSRTALAWVAGSYKSVIEQNSPVGFEDERVEGPDGEMSLHGILLPFCDAGGRIDLIIGAATFKTHSPDRTIDPPVSVAVDGDNPFAWLKAPRSDAPASPTALDEQLRKCKALARKVQTVDSRSRLALYRALEAAYIFAFRTEADPTAYAALLQAAGIKAQARARFTPVLKLMFGPDFDKTRLAEYAAALSYARRSDRTADDIECFFQTRDGGIKGCVAAERVARRAERLPAGPDAVDRASEELRRLPAIGEASDGGAGSGEFVVLLGRRAAARPGIVHILHIFEERRSAMAGIVRRATHARAEAGQTGDGPDAEPTRTAQSDDLSWRSAGLAGLK